jgi:hypothetical protein
MIRTMPTKPPLIVWWLIWGAILSAFFGLYGIFSQFVEFRPASGGAAALAGVVPLALGATCRFLLLPRLLHTAKGFPVFIVGLALAEAGGLVGVFLAGDHKVYFAAAALVLIILHAPGLLRSGH